MTYSLQMLELQRPLSRWVRVAALSSIVWMSSTQAANFLSKDHTFIQSTYLIEITQDSSLSLKARNLSLGGFETSGGNWVGFNSWYSTKWSDTSFSWITQLNPHLGLIWGLSSGERAEKHSIDPGLRLGFLFQTQSGKRSLFSISGSTILGGRLREKTCTADYGEIGGVQEVNCRLAATVLEPSETLKYLYNEKPIGSVQIRYSLFFN